MIIKKYLYHFGCHLSIKSALKNYKFNIISVSDFLSNNILVIFI